MFNNWQQLVCAGLVAMYLLVPAAYAEQLEYQIPDDPGISDGPDMMQTLNDYRASKGWWEERVTRKDGSTIIVVNGIGTVIAPRTSPNFISSRQNAFDKAMLKAKKNVVELLEVEISGELASYYSEPSAARQEQERGRRQREGLARQSARNVANSAEREIAENSSSPTTTTAAQEVNSLLQREIDQRLLERGYDPSRPVDQQTIASVLSEDKFSRAMTSVARSRVIGLQAFKVFENHPGGDQGEIGVIAIWSPKLHLVAASIFSGDTSRLPAAAKSKKPFREQIPENTDALITSFGARQVIGPNGEYGIMAFAQSAPKVNNLRSVNAAYNKSKLAAIYQIRQFAGEAVSVRVTDESSESLTSYSDQMAEYDSSYEEKLRAHAEAIKIAGIQTLKSWKAVHPLTKQPLVGSVVLWTPSASDFGRNLQQEMARVPGPGSSQKQGMRAAESPFEGEYSSASDEADEEAF